MQKSKEILLSDQKILLKGILASHIKQNSLFRYSNEEMGLGKGPGARYNWQFYMANTLYDAKMMELISLLFMQEVHEKLGHYDFQLCGREWSALPLLSGIPVAVNINFGVSFNAFMVKRERKTYGRHNSYEGKIIKDLPVLIIDDVINSTNSFSLCKQACLNEYDVKVLPNAFGVLNKKGIKNSSDKMNYDNYLGKNSIAMYGVHFDDVMEANI